MRDSGLEPHATWIHVEIGLIHTLRKLNLNFFHLGTVQFAQTKNALSSYTYGVTHSCKMPALCRLLSSQLTIVFSSPSGLSMEQVCENYPGNWLKLGILGSTLKSMIQ